MASENDDKEPEPDKTGPDNPQDDIRGDGGSDQQPDPPQDSGTDDTLKKINDLTERLTTLEAIVKQLQPAETEDTGESGQEDQAEESAGDTDDGEATDPDRIDSADDLGYDPDSIQIEDLFKNRER